LGKAMANSKRKEEKERSMEVHAVKNENTANSSGLYIRAKANAPSTCMACAEAVPTSRMAVFFTKADFNNRFMFKCVLV
jgi:hypothetical protein